MKTFLPLVLLLVGCGTLSQPIKEGDKVLEQRVNQIDDAMKRLKSEAIAEARDAAADLVTKARTEFEDAGKEVILLAANELDTKLEKTLEHVNSILEQRIDQAADRVEEIVSTQKDDSIKQVRELMRDEVPVMVESSVMRSADKLAERFGAVKTTTTGPDGVPVEVWALGGSGLLGTVWNVYRIWANKRKGLKRWTEDEFDASVDAKINQALSRSNGNPTPNASVVPSSPDTSFTWTHS